MILLANGCSHTSGADSLPVRTTIEEEKNHSYPRYFADYLNLSCVNLAQPGGSNERTVLTTIDYIIENNLQSKDLLVLVGWTTIHRKYFKNDDGEFFWCPGTVGPEDCLGHDGRWRKVPGIEKYFQYWITYDTYHKSYLRSFFHNILYLHTFLKVRKINHLFINAWQVYQFEHQYQTNIIEAIPNYLNPFDYTATLQWCGEHNNCELKPTVHYDYKAHQFYAKYLFDVTKKGGQLQMYDV